MNKIFIEDCCEILDSMRVPITASKREIGEYPYYGANGIQDYVADYIFDDELVLLAEDGGNFGSKERPIAYRVSGKCWVNNHAHVLKPKVGLDIDYLCYSLMFYKVDGLINGATRKKLTQAAMRKMQIPFRSIKEQIHIVNELNRIIKIKEKKEHFRAPFFSFSTVFSILTNALIVASGIFVPCHIALNDFSRIGLKPYFYHVPISNFLVCNKDITLGQIRVNFFTRVINASACSIDFVNIAKMIFLCDFVLNFCVPETVS